MNCAICGGEMPAGRQLAYCGKGCRSKWRERTSPIDKTAMRGVLNEFFARAGRTVAGRLGCMTFDEAWQDDRWRRELANDLPGREAVAELIVDTMRANFSQANSPAEVVAMAGRMRDRADDAEVVIETEVPGSHLVYLLYDARGRLLYVGITDRGPTRLVEHYRSKTWFAQVSRVEFRRCRSRVAAEASERHLIQTLRPAHNVIFNRAPKTVDTLIA